MWLQLPILMVLMRTPYTIPFILFILFIHVNYPSSVKRARVSSESSCLFPRNVLTCFAKDRRSPKREGTKPVMLDADVKQRIIEEYRAHESDTGSTELQVAMLTERIRQVTDHLRTHRKDVHSRRGLVTMVSKRRRLLNYLSREDVGRYQSLIGRLGLRR